MPGRPRTTLKRINELIARAETGGGDLLELIPDHYLERSENTDETSVAWRRAMDAAVMNCQALYAIRNLLMRKVERANASTAGTFLSEACKARPK
jgi:hypothetical protein